MTTEDLTKWEAYIEEHKNDPFPPFAEIVTNTEKQVILGSLTEEDVEAWHNGELTENAAALVEKYGAFQVWGGGDSEPVSIIYPA